MAMKAPLRILCLHDNHSNAAELKETLDLLGGRLCEHHNIDLVYVNSPLVTLQSENNDDDEVHRPRVWWEGEERGSADDGEIRYSGLDASMMLLRQIWASCPFWGIIGIGQGAAVAALLAMMLHSAILKESNETVDEMMPRLSPMPPQFAVFIAGQSLLVQDEQLMDEIAFPTLHIIDPPTDTNRTSHQQQERLVRQFGGAVHHRTTAATFSRQDFNAMGRFVCEQKKWLVSDGTALSLYRQEVVALRTALHVAEQEAADVVAESIANDPPAALMAVIRPSDVAGWKGNKRRQPDEEGGGAPCPFEFLLQRRKRSGKGASRVHPNQQQNRQQFEKEETDSDQKVQSTDT
jgi:hypothetical protein